MDPSFLITPLYNWILWKDFSLLVVSTVYGQEVAAHFSTERMELRLLLSINFELEHAAVLDSRPKLEDTAD